MKGRSKGKGPAAGSDLADEMLEAQLPFKRERATSFLYTPHSPKLNRRVYLYTPRAYWLWVRFETDREIGKFNERPKKVALPLARGCAAMLAPALVTASPDDQLTVHTFAGNVEDADDDESAMLEVDRARSLLEPRAKHPEQVDAIRAGIVTEAWSSWCKSHDFSHHNWTPTEVFEPKMLLRNRAELLRHTSRPGQPFDGNLRKSLLRELSAERSLTVWALKQRLPARPDDEIHAAIAHLILRADVESDIDRHPFSYATRLSAFAGVVGVEAEDDDVDERRADP